MGDEIAGGKEKEGPSNKTPKAITTGHTNNGTETQTETQREIRNLEREMTVHEHRTLNWNRVVGAFTVVLAVTGIFQAFTFIESERAFLVVTDAGFTNGESNADPSGLDLY